MKDDKAPRYCIGTNGVPRILRYTEEQMRDGSIINFDTPDPPPKLNKRQREKQQREEMAARHTAAIEQVAALLNAPDEITMGLYMREMLRKSGVDVTHMSPQYVYDTYLYPKK